ncbi:MAG: flagellar basal body rod protein FlgC [Peptococcaceae bacterium]|nr:flagellar basal body rod protein FlgC [Peptococcaceae bacterium]
MGLFTGMDASASGLTAQRVRLDLIANNIANMSTTRSGQTTAAGNPIPYQRKLPVFEPREPTPSFSAFMNGQFASGSGVTSIAGMGAGVQVRRIISDPKPFRLVYEPDSPDAAQVEEIGIPVGYVRYPNVEIVEEMLDMISATRAYEANVTALNASKTMASRALDIGR